MIAIAIIIGFALGAYGHMCYERAALIEQIKRSEQIEKRRRKKEKAQS